MKEIQKFRAYAPDYWRARGATDFKSAMRYAKREGLRNGAEINFARYVDGNGYNAWMASGRGRQRMVSRVSPAQFFANAGIRIQNL